VSAENASSRTVAAERAASREYELTELADRAIRMNVFPCGLDRDTGNDNLATQTSPNCPHLHHSTRALRRVRRNRQRGGVLASDLFSFTTGSTVTADGGLNQV
jgi:hypothetical protein